MRYAGFVACGLLGVFLLCPLAQAQVVYGKSLCDYCKMIMTEKDFGGEMETANHKVYHFDATECLAAIYLSPKFRPKGIVGMRSILYGKPGKLVDATRASYLRTDKILSPMSVNLAAFATRREAEMARKKLGGEILDWRQVLALITDKWYGGVPK